MDTNEALELIASLEGYLHDLRNTGVDGLPLKCATVAPSFVSTPDAVAPEVKHSAAAALPTQPEHPVVSSDKGPAGGLDGIREELGDCHRCRLGDSRTTLLFGSGNPKPRLVFVGDVPGGDEDHQGILFVGEEGQLLTKIIQAMGLRREDCYLCTVMKCRPPKDRTPQSDEVQECYPFLHKQLKALGPEVIVALGTFVSQHMLKTKEPIMSAKISPPR